MKKVQKEGKEDELLILFVAMLTLAGLFFLYSTGTYNGKVKFGDAGYYLKKQLFASVLGMIAFWVMARIDYHRVAAFATVLYLCSIALSTAVLFVGRSYNGSKRWLALGPLSFQPAEFAKAAVILFLSFRISNRKKKTDSLWFMLRTMAALLPIVGLVGTNNLSGTPEVSAFSWNRSRGDWICRDFFEYGKLSARTPCHLEESGKI